MNKQIKEVLKENNQLEETLTKDNQLLMTDIVCYIRSFPISMIHQESVRKDIIYMLINAQDNNQSQTKYSVMTSKYFVMRLLKSFLKQQKKIGLSSP